MKNELLKDPYWKQVVDFLISNQRVITKVYADKEFQKFGLQISENWGAHVEAESYSVVVIHKGNELDPLVVDKLISEYAPIFANEVFIIFSANSCFNREDASVHYKSFLKKYISIGRQAVSSSQVSNDRPSIYMGKNRALTKTIYGHKIIVDTRDLSLAPHILIDGFWEKWISNIFIDLIEPGMHVLDIGANVGFYSLLAAQRIGKSGRLTCFEANPEIADLVFQNLQINGLGERSNVINKAVYSEDGPLTFNIYERFLGSSSLWAADGHAENYRDKITKITVDGITLDSYIPSGEKVDFIKIDAEGAEPFILKGARRVLQDNPQMVIMMEFAPAIINVAYGSIESFYDEIRSYGFKLLEIKHDSTLTELHRENVSTVGHCDVVLKR